MTPEVWQQLIDAGVTIALTLLVPLILAGINVLLKKANLDQNEAVQRAVRSGIAFAEEYAADLAKQQGAKIDPSAKLNLAITRIIEKIPNITPVEAEKLVKEELPKVGLGAAGFLRATADAVKS